MSLASTDLVQKAMTMLTSTVAGNEFATLLNKGAASALATHICVGGIIATSTSQTVDFGVLKVGDRVIKIHATLGTAKFRTCSVAGTLGEAAVIGDLYVVLRAISLPADSAVKFP